MTTATRLPLIIGALLALIPQHLVHDTAPPPFPRRRPVVASLMSAGVLDSANLKSSPCILCSPLLPCSTRCWPWLARHISRCALSRPSASNATAPVLVLVKRPSLLRPVS